MDTEVDATPENLFRPAKRRKFARRRQDDPEETPSAAVESVAEGSDKPLQATESKPSDDADDSTHATGVVRLRRPRTIRKGGIGFSATTRPSGKDDNRQMALIAGEDQEKETIRAMDDRFQMYTGQAEDVDRHMMAYIDAEMAKRYKRSPLPEGSPADQPDSQSTSGARSTQGHQQERLPASLGKLHEIDLGQETKLQNIARTEAATRRLTGDEDSPGGPADRVDAPGKSWRNRKRRTSADVERDRLVEEILRESKLDVYDEPVEEPQADDQAADDRIAEQFRRDFLDAIQSRRRTRTTKTVSKTEAPKGPKLGGSRSARAAMRESQAQAGKK
ncbi:hypothetical protein PMG11_10940 [Penicillium brasilianum]|uniref:Hepatocellular carcinoma-associated antigen 59-domain-containing protein n=1 Tax=Penicillium brasilianum TaxID=104259 RepID=A0A0F7U2I8_PENBI|nr:hypothetical protein PMG11_10940 [Penicillium brasilianum]